MSGGDDGWVHVFAVYAGRSVCTLSLRAHQKFVRALLPLNGWWELALLSRFAVVLCCVVLCWVLMLT